MAVTAIRQAKAQDVNAVSEILTEAARWLAKSGKPLWMEDELAPTRIATEVDAGLFWLAETDGDCAGTLRFQLEDPLFWPDAVSGEAAYLHRLAIRRRHAGTGLSTLMLHWAVDRTRSLGRQSLRLDCVSSRLRLRAIYENYGFRHRDDRQVGPYLVSRYEYAL